MKAGFVNIFGKPNAGKSTLLNALLGEKLAIVSNKVQTTRNRIKGFLTESDKYQIIFSDTPGIIKPRYKLHEKMMDAVKSALEDADVAILMVDVRDNAMELDEMFQSLKLKVPSIVVLNKVDTIGEKRLQVFEDFFKDKAYAKKIIKISALNKLNIQELIDAILEFLPEGQPFFPEDDMTDLPTKFFVGEMIREKIYELVDEEVPYQTAVNVNTFQEKTTLIKIQADIVVQRNTQKGIIIGEHGAMIKAIGTAARKDIEAFLDSKVFLELYVKIRPKWRENDIQLKEYGY